MKPKDKLNGSRDSHHPLEIKGEKKNICLNPCCSQLG